VARVTLVGAQQAPLLARPYFEGGDPGPIAAALAQVPELIQAGMGFIGAVYGPGSVPARQREIVILRTSARHGCRYCVAVHTRAAARAGLTAAEIDELQGAAPGSDWSQPDRALVEFSDRMSTDPARAVDALGSHFQEHQVVELVTLAAATIFLNRFATALSLPLP